MNTPDIDYVLEAAERDDCIGFCANCGEEASGVEPDARRYICGRAEVYGAAEFLLEFA